MNRFLLLIVASLIAGSLGCDRVTLDAVVGEPLPQSEKAAFVGQWINEESEIYEFRLTSQGELVASSKPRDARQQEHRSQDQAIDVRKVGAAVFFLTHDDPYDIVFVRIARTTESEFEMHTPDPAKFRAAVEQGKLSGTVITRDDGHFTVRIHVDSKLTDPVLSSEELTDWYVDESMQAFRRIEQSDEGIP